MSARPEIPVTLAPSRSGWGRATALALVVAAAVTMGAVRLDLGRLLPSVPHPFASHTVDRSQPPLRKSLEDLSRYLFLSG